MKCFGYYRSERINVACVAFASEIHVPGVVQNDAPAGRSAATWAVEKRKPIKVRWCSAKQSAPARWDRHHVKREFISSSNSGGGGSRMTPTRSVGRREIIDEWMASKAADAGSAYQTLNLAVWAARVGGESPIWAQEAATVRDKLRKWVFCGPRLNSGLALYTCELRLLISTIFNQNAQNSFGNHMPISFSMYLPCANIICFFGSSNRNDAKL